MSNQLTEQVVIVGGGTAGWLTAAKLAKHLHTSQPANSSQPKSVQVTLIESPDIPTIGVGEGTWPTMRKTLMDLGINESEFMAYCQATFKQGTQFINWRQEPLASQSENNSDNTLNSASALNNSFDNSNQYFHMFSSALDPADFNLSPYWLAGVAGNDMPFADAVSAQASVCRNGLAPKKITQRQYDGALNYAYHLDAGKFANFLMTFATEKLGVKLVRANVVSVNQNELGDIASVVLDSSETIAGDLFVDCSGFKSLLLGEALGVEFVSVDNTLLTDSAVAIQVPYDNEQEAIACHTKSTAQNAGWVWDIGLYNRRGTGFVYSSNHISDDEAEQCLRDYLGERSSKAITQLSAKKLSMNVGYRKQHWHRNCVAIGLSAAFVEPLEASAIFLIEAAGNMLVDMFPADRAAMDYCSRRFNDSLLKRWRKTIDFIKLHYLLSQRQTSFWKDNRMDSTIPESLKERVEHWRFNPVSKYDFDNVFEPFPQESYHYVLYGMGLRHIDSDNNRVPGDLNYAQQSFQEIQKFTEHLLKTLPDHRALLTKVYQYGFQAV